MNASRSSLCLLEGRYAVPPFAGPGRAVTERDENSLGAGDGWDQRAESAPSRDPANTSVAVTGLTSSSEWSIDQLEMDGFLFLSHTAGPSYIPDHHSRELSAA